MQNFRNIAQWSRFAPLLSGGIVLGCLVYCRFWWTPRPMSLTDPDCSIVCWMFCNTMSSFWFSLGVLFSLISLLSSVMICYNVKRAKLITLISGLLIFPSGLINLAPYFYYKNNR